MNTWREIPLSRRETGLLEERERDGLDADALLFMARDMASFNLWWRSD